MMVGNPKLSRSTYTTGDIEFDGIIIEYKLKPGTRKFIKEYPNEIKVFTTKYLTEFVKNTKGYKEYEFSNIEADEYRVAKIILEPWGIKVCMNKEERVCGW